MMKHTTRAHRYWLRDSPRIHRHSADWIRMQRRKERRYWRRNAFGSLSGIMQRIIVYNRKRRLYGPRGAWDLADDDLPF